MGYLNEYINKNLSAIDYQEELRRLIAEYKKIRNADLFIFASDLSSNGQDISINQKDYYTMHDMLVGRNDIENIDVYLETPGGSGEAAEEIINLLRRNQYKKVSFVIAGEAKSAGTIIALSGDEILMTETASLGPIDAQVKIGRSIISAYDYMEWVEEKQQEAQSTNKLNPFDAVMIAQISPGELFHVENAKQFAIDVVVSNLQKYKFKNWSKTKDRGIEVTTEMKKAKAEDIAKSLVNHKEFRSHGRSIKIEKLSEMGLEIVNIEENKKLSEIVHRIHIVLRLYFEKSSVYKIFINDKNTIVRMALEKNQLLPLQKPQVLTPDVVNIEVPCSKCHHVNKFYGKLKNNKNIDLDMGKKGIHPVPKTGKFECENCGVSNDLMGVINQIETQFKKKIIF